VSHILIRGLAQPDPYEVLVDYGESHSLMHHHKRYGRLHEKGLYPRWSSSYPLHFLGHSMGGPTIVKMVSLIRDGFFGVDTFDDVVASVTTLSAPFRGSGIVYEVHESRAGLPHAQRFSVSTNIPDRSVSKALLPQPENVIAKCIRTLIYISPLIPSFMRPDFHAEARRLTFWDLSPLQFWKSLRANDWAQSRDVTSWDLTFEAADQFGQDFWDSASKSRERTWFRSYCATLVGSILTIPPIS
jgi:hypothetical protein